MIEITKIDMSDGTFTCGCQILKSFIHSTKWRQQPRNYVCRKSWLWNLVGNLRESLVMS